MRNIDWEVVLVRIRLIVKYCDTLEDFRSISLDEYLGDFYQQLIVERLIQLMVEAATDINKYLLLQLYEINPTTNFDSFSEAGQKGIITQKLADELAQSVGMRNILVHQYKDINSRIVFSAIPKAVDSIKAARRHNVIQDYRLTDNDNRISNLEKQNEEILRTLAKFSKKLSIHETQIQEFQDSVQLLEAEIPYLRHLVYRNEELQNERDFFCPPD